MDGSIETTQDCTDQPLIISNVSEGSKTNRHLLNNKHDVGCE
jgi:hypothetical protein